VKSVVSEAFSSCFWTFQIIFLTTCSSLEVEEVNEVGLGPGGLKVSLVVHHNLSATRRRREFL